MPVAASDDYVRQLAALVKKNLNPNLTAYVEYANETWSTLHEPGKYNLAQAKAANHPGKAKQVFASILK